jgi:hypothetical protein
VASSKNNEKQSFIVINNTRLACPKNKNKNKNLKYNDHGVDVYMIIVIYS